MAMIRGADSPAGGSYKTAGSAFSIIACNFGLARAEWTVFEASSPLLKHGAIRKPGVRFKGSPAVILPATLEACRFVIARLHNKALRTIERHAALIRRTLPSSRGWHAIPALHRESA